MVDGRSDQIAFDGLRGAGGNGSMLQGIGWGAGQLASVLVTPDHGDVGIRPTLYRAVAWMASLCIRTPT
jgi:hypothetical protein